MRFHARYRAAEGALLVCGRRPGEAQTVANTFLAAQHNLTIIPVIKIDLPAAQPEQTKEQIENVLAIPASDALLISAKAASAWKWCLKPWWRAFLRRPRSKRRCKR